MTIRDDFIIIFMVLKLVIFFLSQLRRQSVYYLQLVAQKMHDMTFYKPPIALEVNLLTFYPVCPHFLGQRWALSVHLLGSLNSCLIILTCQLLLVLPSADVIDTSDFHCFVCIFSLIIYNVSFLNLEIKCTHL